MDLDGITDPVTLTAFTPGVRVEGMQPHSGCVLSFRAGFKTSSRIVKSKVKDKDERAEEICEVIPHQSLTAAHEVLQNFAGLAKLE